LSARSLSLLVFLLVFVSRDGYSNYSCLGISN
jgi:hypothetical protein